MMPRKKRAPVAPDVVEENEEAAAEVEQEDVVEDEVRPVPEVVEDPAPTEKVEQEAVPEAEPLAPVEYNGFTLVVAENSDLFGKTASTKLGPVSFDEFGCVLVDENVLRVLITAGVVRLADDSDLEDYRARELVKAGAVPAKVAMARLLAPKFAGQKVSVKREKLEFDEKGFATCTKATAIVAIGVWGKDAKIVKGA